MKNEMAHKKKHRIAPCKTITRSSSSVATSSIFSTFFYNFCQTLEKKAYFVNIHTINLPMAFFTTRFQFHKRKRTRSKLCTATTFLKVVCTMGWFNEKFCVRVHTDTRIRKVTLRQWITLLLSNRVYWCEYMSWSKLLQLNGKKDINFFHRTILRNTLNILWKFSKYSNEEDIFHQK